MPLPPCHVTGSEKTVCLRNSRMAVTVPKRIYVDEATRRHVPPDISARLSQVPTSANLAQSQEAREAVLTIELSVITWPL